uniref:Small ribosomal subunit protein bS20c n=1 Tax=Caloglossa beccarii TaxID=131038 RepID=A0A1Z1M968_9FLOR|nr:ribosomal protein S20 [Caloglossa beccarii]ARW62284.1 ribosomal protein S20 [Caloglossa beccarii]
MSKNLSANKRVEISLRNRLQNKKYKIAIKKSIKKYLFNLDNNPISDMQMNLSIVYKTIDKAVKKGIWHKNKANRKKSRLAKIIKSKF